jgi:YidC/Oxa1 family membrane protein insertase
VQARLAPRLKEIAARCQGDARAVSAATMKLLREQHVRPLVNLLASTLQILLFTLTFGVVVEVAKGSQERFLWIPALGEHDPLYVLPLLTGLCSP